jgi:integrase
MAVRFCDLDLANGTAMVERSKNGERRVLVLTAPLIAEIKRLGVGAPEALLFGRATRPLLRFTFDTAWQRLLTDARIEDFRFHDLRHSCASMLAQNGAMLLEIADVLGHKQLDVTRRYSHLCVEHKSKLVQRVLGGIGGGES